MIFCFLSQEEQCEEIAMGRPKVELPQGNVRLALVTLIIVKSQCNYVSLFLQTQKRCSVMEPICDLLFLFFISVVGYVYLCHSRRMHCNVPLYVNIETY